MGAAADSNADERDERTGAGPLRTCVVTRVQRPPDEMLRFVLDPQGGIVVDLACRLPGRGVWVTGTKAAVATAVKTKAFSRSLKQPAPAPADLAEIIERLMLKRVCDTLSLANKAGLVITGFSKVEKAIACGTACALAHAHDASSDGSNRLNRQYFAMSRDADQPARVVLELSVDQLSLALGRSNVVHAALETGGVTGFFLSAVERLQRFKAGKPDAAALPTA